MVAEAERLSGATLRGERAAGLRERGGIFFKLLVFLVVVFAFVALAWMLFLPVVLTAQLRARTGFDATVERLVVNPLSGTIELRGLVLTNPPTFPVRDFIELREFRAEAGLFALFSERPVFDSMTIDIPNVTLVKRSDGSTNAEIFQHNLNSDAQNPPPPPRAGAARAKTFLVKRLTLRIDRLVIADHSGRRPVVREFKLGIDQTSLNVTDTKQLFGPAVLQGLGPVATALGGLLPGDVGKVIGQAAKSSSELLKDAGRTTGEKVKGFFDALEEKKKP